jgi:hypothetical protein
MATEKQATEKQPAQERVKISTEGLTATYANLCRVTSTPEEVIMDFAVNPNAFGAVLDEPLKADHRIIMSFYAAKRVAVILAETIRRHETAYGAVELDPRKRLKSGGTEVKR